MRRSWCYIRSWSWGDAGCWSWGGCRSWIWKCIYVMVNRFRTMNRTFTSTCLTIRQHRGTNNQCKRRHTRKRGGDLKIMYKFFYGIYSLLIRISRISQDLELGLQLDLDPGLGLEL
jgi:hypothetical protein